GGEVGGVVRATEVVRQGCADRRGGAGALAVRAGGVVDQDRGADRRRGGGLVVAGGDAGAAEGRRVEGDGGVADGEGGGVADATPAHGGRVARQGGVRDDGVRGDVVDAAADLGRRVGG